MQVPWVNLFYSALVFLIVGSFAKKAYHYLARYQGWQSPWKRLLAISPILLGTAFLVVAIFLTLTKK